ncbi:unnamed protein product, partial [Amoebophrya sp. A120]
EYSYRSHKSIASSDCDDKLSSCSRRQCSSPKSCSDDDDDDDDDSSNPFFKGALASGNPSFGPRAGATSQQERQHPHFSCMEPLVLSDDSDQGGGEGSSGEPASRVDSDQDEDRTSSRVEQERLPECGRDGEGEGECKAQGPRQREQRQPENDST